jgi:hypothetical protein
MAAMRGTGPYRSGAILGVAIVALGLPGRAGDDAGISNPLPGKPAEAKSAVPPPPPRPAAGAATTAEPRRVRIRDDRGRAVVARVHGGEGSGAVLLPDGQLGWPTGMAYTDEPFRPATTDEMAEDLLASPLFASFQVRKSPHYLVLYAGSREFADASVNLLESLYLGLLAKFREKGLEVHEAEFPLVAIIYRTEEDFRAHSNVAPEVQAYYQVLTNRILFYETSRRDRAAPEIAARRKPQTVAHEGTHQILQNIGIHPRLASWPLWLVEGLAEYCAPTTTKRGGGWAGFNKINPFHMATLRDLNDPLTISLEGRGQPRRRGRERERERPADLQALLTSESLSATDYARAWGLTYYLANKKFDAFLAYLKEMGRMPPEANRFAEDHLAAFRAHFGSDLAATGRAMNRYLASLKNYEPIPYYAVAFEQPIGRGLVQRAALVSQSPAMIYQWIQNTTSPRGEPPVWHAWPFESRTRAILAANQWLEGR